MAKKVLLRGDEGYYAAEEVIDGVHYRVRELDEAEYKTWKMHSETIGSLLREADAIAANMRGPEARDLTDEEVVRMSELEDLVRAEKIAQVDFVAGAGIVWWSDKDRPASEENIIGLPPSVKAILAGRIMRETNLTQNEADFLVLQPKQ